jgi:hypothetical protein
MSKQKTDYSKTDHLKSDPILPEQEWAVISFVNPVDNIRQKNLYYANRFLIADINKELSAQARQLVKKVNVDMRNQIQDTLDKLRSSVNEEDKHLGKMLGKHFDEMSFDEDKYVEGCRRQYELDDEVINDKYSAYITANRQALDHEYDRAHEYATSTRGIKVRGMYQDLANARDRAQFCRDELEPAIPAFVIPAGKWCPMDFEVDEISSQEYMLPQLNDLMGKFNEGVHAKNMHFQERKREMQEAAHEHNVDNIKSRLQDKLHNKRASLLKKETAALSTLHGDATTSTTAPKTKKKKTKKTASPVETLETVEAVNLEKQ